VRVVSWNVWWRFGGNWRDRERAIVVRLREANADVIGLQEVWGDDGLTQADVIAEALGLYAAFSAPSLPPVPVPAKSVDQEGVSLGVAVLSR
jgi:endonuclease/exonuclease/phosphatase family metal-dependent hydrolase